MGLASAFATASDPIVEPARTLAEERYAVKDYFPEFLITAVIFEEVIITQCVTEMKSVLPNRHFPPLCLTS